MERGLRDYEPVVGADVLDDLRSLAGHLKGVRLRNVNTTAVGGGVAEILHRMVPLLRELGIDAAWELMKGGEDFFAVTKTMHNALHGRDAALTEAMRAVYEETTERNLREMDLSGDVVLIHDPQPAGLVARRGGTQRWLWRCHIDLSGPVPEFWEFLRPRVERYDAAIFSAPLFVQALPVPRFVVAPSIDPLGDKNRDLPPETVRAVLERHGIDPKRPILLQVSRFDRLKDPLGVLEAYRIVRKSRRHARVQLVLAGGTALDDPEGSEVLAEVRERAGKDPDVHLLLLPPDAHEEINALQRGATVVLQKSLREGFALTVTEALWKGKPVVAGAVGGIPLQVIHGETGLLVRSPEEAAAAVRKILEDPAGARRMGENGREHVRHNFVITRHLREYLCALLAVLRGRDGLTFLD